MRRNQGAGRVAAIMLCCGLLGLLVVRASPAAAREADPWFGADKALHFSASFVLAGSGYAVGIGAFDHRGKAAALGTGIALGAGIAKELLDLAGMGQPSWRDITWNVIGTAAGLGVAMLIDLAARGLNPTKSATLPGQGLQGGLSWRF